MAILKELQQVLYAGYGVCKSAGLLNGQDLFYKTGMFAAYEKAVFDLSGYSTLREDYNLYKNWCSKTAKFMVVNRTEAF
jgi:hypothetical protein